MMPALQGALGPWPVVNERPMGISSTLGSNPVLPRVSQIKKNIMYKMESLLSTCPTHPVGVEIVRSHELSFKFFFFHYLSVLSELLGI